MSKHGERHKDCEATKVDDDYDTKVVPLSVFAGKKRHSKTAEGMGLEPTTGKPAPDFESGC